MNDRDRLSLEIDKCLAGELDQRESVLICHHTPLILQKLGLQDYPILFSQRHVHNCLHPKGERSQWHGLYRDDLLELPGQLCEPAIVYDSLSSDDSIVVATGTVDLDDLPIIASIRIDGEGQYKFEKLNSNYLTSIYGHEHFANIINRSINEDGILYVNKEKTQELGNLSQLQLLRGLPQIGYEGIIHKSENIVNSETKPIFNKSEVEEFNQKWKDRGIYLIETNDWKIVNNGFYKLMMQDKPFKNGIIWQQPVLTLNLDGTLKFDEERANTIKTIDWIMSEEKGFYKNNPDVCDEWNEQSKQFYEIRKDLLNDIECMFAPCEDQMEEFNKAVKFIKEKMHDEYLNVAGWERCPGRPGYIQEKKDYQNPKVDSVENVKNVSESVPMEQEIKQEKHPSRNW